MRILVSAAGGASGRFLQNIFSYLLLGTPLAEIDAYGSAHQADRDLIFPWYSDQTAENIMALLPAQFKTETTPKPVYTSPGNFLPGVDTPENWNLAKLLIDKIITAGLPDEQLLKIIRLIQLQPGCTENTVARTHIENRKFLELLLLQISPQTKLVQVFSGSNRDRAVMFANSVIKNNPQQKLDALELYVQHIERTPQFRPTIENYPFSVPFSLIRLKDVDGLISKINSIVTMSAVQQTILRDHIVSYFSKQPL